MFCPKCGQPQADDVRFCSRCGFPLAGVNELLLRGGQLSVVSGAEASTERRESPKRQGIRQGGAMMLIGMFALLLVLALLLLPCVFELLLFALLFCPRVVEVLELPCAFSFWPVNNCLSALK